MAAGLLEELKAAGEDFEWYPTTPEIIGFVARDMRGRLRERDYYGSECKHNGILDVGAGDGRVLTRISECIDRMLADDRHCRTVVEMYAIERSTIHLQNLPKEIVVLGTDFMEQTLIDKPMRFIFSNPPYSEYEEWAVKLIREAHARYVYLVIPVRWKDSLEIQKAVELRGATIEVLGEFDFENAERRARAVVNIVRVRLSTDEKDSPFDAAIEDMMPELKEFDRMAKEPLVHDDEDLACEVLESSENLVESLVKAYDAEIEQLIATYRSAAKIKPQLLNELGVSKQAIMTGLRSKIQGLKEKYWQSLFEHFKPITKRLATKQRKAFLSSLTGKATVDFTESNIYSMLIWVTKWSNDYFDTQLVELFRSLSEFCNVVRYKSNERVWTKGDWRYYDLVNCRDGAHKELSRYKLEYRIVLEHSGGICTSRWDWEARSGLACRAFEFIQDIVTVANNLGFDCNDGPERYGFESGTKNTIMLADGTPLVAVRAYKNQNMHLQFNPKVMLAINVEAGRLLGWLRDPEQAARELDATPAEAEVIRNVFDSSFRIAANNVLRLTVA